MRLQTKGKTSVNKVTKIIKEVVAETLTKANIVDELKYKVENFSCDIVFIVDGAEQKITVKHNGLDEIFTVGVALDNKGNITKTADNEKESYVDKYTASEITGQPMELESICSQYAEDEVEEISRVTEGGAAEVTYKIKATDETLIRYYKDDKLVGEIVA